MLDELCKDSTSRAINQINHLPNLDIFQAIHAVRCRRSVLLLLHGVTILASDTTSVPVPIAIAIVQGRVCDNHKRNQIKSMTRAQVIS